MGRNSEQRATGGVAVGGNSLPPVVEGGLAVVVAMALAGLLVTAAVQSVALAVLASAAALYLALLTILGRDRMAAATVLAAFFTAPYFKTFNPSAAITPTDILLGIAVLLFLPTVVERRLHLPTVFWVGLAVVVVTGLAASAAAAQPLVSLINLAQWLTVLLGLPLLYVLWRPSPRMVQTLLWGYVAGHMVSVASTLVTPPLPNGRYDGLTHHPNAFAEAGLISVAALLFLFHQHRSLWTRVVVLLAGAAAVVSVMISGSRSATAVLAVLLLLVPIVERSAVWGFLMALAGGVAVLFLPAVIGLTGDSSALSRLRGTGDADIADRARESANQTAWRLFGDSPLLGNGYVDALNQVHNTYLEIAASAGVLAVIGYLMVLFWFVRPLFGEHPLRRLSYMAWAYLGLQVALPSLWDRTAWVPMALAILAAVRVGGSEVEPPVSRPGPSRSSRSPERSPGR